MDNRFLKGIAIGLTCALVLAGITIGIYMTIGKENMDNDRMNRTDQSVISDMTEEGSTWLLNDGIEEAEESLYGQTGKNAAGAVSSDTVGTDDPEAAQRELFNRKLDLIKKYIDYYYYQGYDMEEVYDKMLHAMVEALGDPYSEYYSPNEYSDIVLNSTGNYSGIGTVVTQYVTDRKMYILYPYDDTPASEAGLQPMDEIVGVDGEDVVGWDLNDVVYLMRGPEGTEVDLTIVRDGERLTFHMVRREIVLQYVESHMIDDEIGYIYCTQFTTAGATQFAEQLKELKNENIKGLIIDLRDNPGGMVDACVQMVDQILPAGKTVVYTEDKNGKKAYETTTHASSIDCPIVVLGNMNSASASEIFIGCLRDHDRATFVGTRTFGKGIVQAIIPINYDNSGLKLTGWRYFTPNGVCIDGVGLAPDIEIELEEGLETLTIPEREHDNQLEKAIEVLRAEMAEADNAA